MAEIKKVPFLRHLRAEPTSHVLGYRGGRLRREGPGQAFWFRAINTAIAPRRSAACPRTHPRG